VPKKYVLGKSKIIKGWEEGIPTMEKKEVAMVRLVILLCINLPRFVKHKLSK
jgi:hypothetical protein